MNNINTLVYNVFQESLFNPDGKGNYNSVRNPSKILSSLNIKRPTFRKHEKRGKPIAFQSSDYFAKLFAKPPKPSFSS